MFSLRGDFGQYFKVIDLHRVVQAVTKSHEGSHIKGNQLFICWLPCLLKSHVISPGPRPTPGSPLTLPSSPGIEPSRPWLKATPEARAASIISTCQAT